MLTLYVMTAQVNELKAMMDEVTITASDIGARLCSNADSSEVGTAPTRISELAVDAHCAAINFFGIHPGDAGTEG